MPIQDLIEVAFGTVTGRDHTFGGNLVLGKPNQDAIVTVWTRDAFIAVLCDGCSSGEHSEVGSQLISQMLINEIAFLMEKEGETFPQSPGVWSFGDCAVFREKSLSHQRFPGNAPPYPGYLTLPRSTLAFSVGDLVFRPIIASGDDKCLLDSSLDSILWRLTQSMRFFVRPNLSARQCVERYLLCTVTVAIIDESVLDFLPMVVGTDGLADVPDPSVFLEDRMFANSANVTRTLRKMNQPTVRISGDPPRLAKTDGILPDDTTLVAIRRKVQPCE